MHNQTYDVLIIGSGAAGCVVAGYLAENTKLTIAVLEAGNKDTDPLIHIPAGYSKILASDHHVWQYDTVPQYGKIKPFRMGKVVGGGSSVNAMCYVRGQKRDFDSWYAASGRDSDWSYDSLCKTYIEQEKNNTFHNEYHGIDGDLAVALPHGINELNLYCLKAFQEYGLPYNADYNGHSQRGVSPVQANIGSKKRCSSYVAHLKCHVDSGRVILLTEHEVSKILIKDKKAIGVEVIVDKKQTEILAEHVILSAGAVQSPKILMHSGIGAEQQLKQFAIDVKCNLTGVGENLHDHPIIPVSCYVKGDLGYQNSVHGIGTLKAGMEYLLTKEGPASSNGIETVSYWDPTNLEGEPTVQCYHEPIISPNGLSPSGNRSGITFALVVLQPRSRGSVKLADANPLSMPLIDPNFIGDNYDLEVGLQAVKSIRKVIKQQSLVNIIDDELMPGNDIQTDDQIKDYVKDVATTMWHPVGTCKMGTDEKSVVDANLQIRGIDNLHVIDASIMPNITSGNTNGPTQALALIGIKRWVKRFYQNG